MSNTEEILNQEWCKRSGHIFTICVVDEAETSFSDVSIDSVPDFFKGQHRDIQISLRQYRTALIKDLNGGGII